jgi:hypothetical protein
MNLLFVLYPRYETSCRPDIFHFKAFFLRIEGSALELVNNETKYKHKALPECP